MQLHHDAEQVHRRVHPEQRDHSAQIIDADQHADQHDHQRRAEGVLVEAGRIHALLQILHVPPVPKGSQSKVSDGREQ